MAAGKEPRSASGAIRRTDCMNDANELPADWAAVPLRAGLITDIQTGFACGAHNRMGDGIAHLRPMNVSTEGRIDLSVLKSVPEKEAGKKERLLQQGDVLF